MKNILNRLKDRLSQNEYLALKKAMREIKMPHVPTRFDVCFACRYDIDLAYSIVSSLRKNINDSLSLCEYIAGVKTLYLTDRNNRQKAECSYEIEGDLLLIKHAFLTTTANAHLMVALPRSKDALTLCKAVKLFDDLKFLAGEINEDKSVYEKFKENTENALKSISVPTSKKLVSAYLSIPSLEEADKLSREFDKIFSALARTKKDTSEIAFWSEKGLDVYGYNEQCERIRTWAIERYLAQDSRFSPAIMSEIIINN